MNATTKIVMAATAGVLVTGGVMYAVFRSSPEKPSAGARSKGDAKPQRIPPPPTMIWNEQLARQMAAVAEEEWKKAGSPKYSAQGSLELARAVAKRMYPTSSVTKSDGWPKSETVSNRWHAEASGQKNPDASAWRRAHLASAEAMGYTPVT